MQSDLLSFAEGPKPRALACDDDADDEHLGGYVPGGRCARCGKPLRGGGLMVAFVGFCCWRCFHEPMGRRDGRVSASSDPSGERNCGYNWRR